jgi:glutamate/tyrosine decarboxylase-like PLP-dependent enzyme
LATHGTDAYRDAVETTLATARAAADLIRRTAHLELLVEPELSIVVFRRRGWALGDYDAWSDAQLASGESFVVPTAWRGDPALRICIVNPLTTSDDIAVVVDSLR